jgi:glycosyltransferase involved in cell wall biosynthesis
MQVGENVLKRLIKKICLRIYSRIDRLVNGLTAALLLPKVSYLGNLATDANIDYYLRSSTQINQAFITESNVAKRVGYLDSWTKAPSTPLRPLRVMVLGLRGFPNVQGGVETHMEHLAPLLVNHGCQLEVVVRAHCQKKETGKTWQGVRFTRIWAPKSKGIEAVVHTFLGVLYAGVKRPDILHIHAVGPALMTPLARLLGLTVVVTHHGPDYDRQKWGIFAKNVLKLGEWAGMKFSNGRIVISNVIGELVESKHNVKSELIYNGVKIPDLTAPESHIEQFGLKKNRYILLVSRIVPEKRHLDLIHAFNQANIEGYKLVLVGSSDHPDEYVSTVLETATKNPNIVLTGFQKGEMLRSLYTHAALFVLPSSHEGLSISLLEALSFGLPVLASDIPANLELNLPATSYFEMGNVDALTRMLKLKLANPMSHEAKMNIRYWVSNNYDWQKIAEKTYGTYRSVFR